MIILGLALTLDYTPGNKEPVFLDNAAALIVDGNAVSVMDRKKLNKLKKNKPLTSFPAVWFVLKDYGIKLKDVDKIAIFGSQDHLNLNPGNNINPGDQIPGKLQQEFNIDINPRDLFFVNPHFTYAMEGFTMSGYDRCLALTRHQTHSQGSLMVFKIDKHTIEELDSFPGTGTGESEAKNISACLTRHQKDGNYPGLCLTGNKPLPALLEENLRAAGIFQDLFSHPGEYASGWARGAGLYLYRLETPTQQQPEVKYQTYRNDTEKILTEIWQEILSKEKIGINDNFFFLGGNSIKAIVLENEIHKVFNVKLPLSEVFRYPTIKELSQCINRLPQNQYASIPAVEKKEYYALSSAQKSLYIVQQMDINSTAYNLLNLILLKEVPEPKRLKETFKNLAQRHESFRTSFEMIRGKPMQHVYEANEVEFNIAYYDLKTYDPSAKTNQKLQIPRIIENFIRPFDLSTAPLVRVGLIKIDKARSILVIDMHHIISDAVSMMVLTQDFNELFKENQLPPLKIQYKDFSGWQNSEAIKKAVNQQEQYWLNQFKDEIPVLHLPTDYLRPEVRNFAGSTVSFKISKEQTLALNQIALEQGVTLFILLLAVTTLFLAKLSGQEDIVIGTPVLGRSHPDVEQVIGMFVNTLVLRNYAQPDQTFGEFLNSVKERTLEAFENQDYPFEELVEKLPIQPDPSRNPLFDFMFALENVQKQELKQPAPDIDDLNALDNEYENKTAKFDLSLDVIEEEPLFFVLEYNAQLFNRKSIEQWIIYYKEIVSSVIKNKHIQLAEITISHGFTDVESTLHEDEAGDFGF